MSERIELKPLDEDINTRLDVFLSNRLEGVSRSYAAKLIEDGRVSPNYKPSYKMSAEDEIIVELPDAEPLEAIPQNIPIDIIYEDKDVIVINKPKGMVVHPDNTHKDGTLVNAVLYHCKDLSGIGGVMRPGIVHRIDMNTTGSVIICKNDMAHAHIAAQLKDHSLNRRYVCIVNGNLKEDSGTVDAPIGRNEKDRKKMAVNHRNGKHAVTHYRVLKRLKGFTLVECKLETGRTHQIRVHMASIGHPVLGDEVYGGSNKKFKLQGQCLHAKVLGFIQPSTNEYVETIVDEPEYFQELIAKLEQ